VLALGLDGYPRGWVVAGIEDAAFAFVEVYPTVADALDAYPGAVSVGIDMPIGLPDGPGVRPADLEARALLGRRASSVFATPSRPVIEAPTHAEAIKVARAMAAPAPSAQAYALRAKILEVAPLAATDTRVFEVHPEVAFHVLNGGPLRASKRSWGGLAERLYLLETLGLAPPADFPGAAGPAPDDVLDAVVTAFVAWKHARGEARFFPEHAPAGPHHRIWFADPGG
jgi:predicted RNase H-like nuclease